MGRDSGITWCDHTFNPWRGCCKVSTGCANCYAERDYGAKLRGKGLQIWGPTARREPAAESYWSAPLRWDSDAASREVRPRVFCASLADVFEGPETCQYPLAYEVVEAGRRRLWDLIRRTPNLDWLLLTKRPANILEMVPRPWREGFPAHVWVGVSVEDQATADERIPLLLQVPAQLRFVSAEPLLGEIALWRYLCDECDQCGRPMPRKIGGCFGPDGDDDCDGGRRVLPKLDWVIAGGESGPEARPTQFLWVDALRSDCLGSETPFHFKQWGEWAPGAVLDPKPYWDLTPVRVGKAAAGRKIYGKIWDQFPESPAAAAASLEGAAQ